jgi:peptidoglycan/LPS O-acetylase OafA/YrhL
LSFLFIIVVQAVIAFINYFIVFRIGPQQFYALPKVLHTSFIFFTNATLTFVFSEFIPMLDGGYWSLVAEVMFYLIYPLVAWLLIRPIKRLSRTYWVLWYFASMTVCYGFFMVFQHFIAFETAHIHFAHHFPGRGYFSLNCR